MSSGLPALPAGPRAIRPLSSTVLGASTSGRVSNPPTPSGAANAAYPSSSSGAGATPAGLGHRDPVPRTTFYPAAAQGLGGEGPRLLPVSEPQYSAHSPVRGSSHHQHVSMAATDAAPAPRQSSTQHSRTSSAGSAAYRDVSGAAAPAAVPERHSMSMASSSNAAAAGGGAHHHSSSSQAATGGSSSGGGGGAPIPETELMRELVYVMLGSEETQHSTWVGSEERYALTKGTLRQQNLFDRLQEGGVLRRKIKRLLATQSASFLQQSLKKAVERQLEQHDLFIASLRERSPMSIGDLEIAHRKSLPKLHALFVILRDSESAKGGELVTRLQSLHQHGGREMGAFLSDVYREAVRPLLHMTVHWITKGEIVDPYLEFFICANPNVKESDDGYWATRFTLRTDMLPATFTLQQAKDVLLIGKNIDFIHRCCKAKDWKMAPSIVVAARAATFDNPQSVADVIQEALLHTNEAVLHLLFTKNSLAEVLGASRSLFLVATGDLFDLIVDRLEPLLSAPGIRIDPSLVEESLKTAGNSIAPYLTAPERDALDHVQVVLDTSDRTLSGFDCFAISLPFMKPHNAVLHQAAVLEYQNLFRFLYRVKRADVLVKAAWRQSIFLDRRRGRTGTREHQDVAMHRSVALFKHVSGFVCNLQMYLVTEVIQNGWIWLQRSLKEAKSLDDVIHAHDAYLELLCKRALLDHQYSKAADCIHVMLDLTFTYCALQQQLETCVYSRNDNAVRAIIDKLLALFDDFTESMSRLLIILEEDTVQFDFLQPLGSRLNFNNFYHVDADKRRTEF